MDLAPATASGAKDKTQDDTVTHQEGGEAMSEEIRAART